MPRIGIEDQKQEALDFGRRLSWVRKLLEITPTRLAADIGVDSSSIRLIERGERMPSVHHMRSMCHVLRISPQYLMWGSLEGVEHELAAKLKAAHPELNWPGTPTAHDSIRSSSMSTARLPMTPTVSTVPGSR